LVDLDGVLNAYNGHYNENFIPPIKEGAFEFIKKLAGDYKVVLFTTRNLLLATQWVLDNNLQDYIYNISNVKEPCILIIDDRAINFNGDYNDLEEKIKNFKPWYKKN